MIVPASSLDLTRTDGTKLYIEIDPVAILEEGQTVKTGVYQLQATRYDDPAQVYTEDNPGDTTDIAHLPIASVTNMTGFIWAISWMKRNNHK